METFYKDDNLRAIGVANVLEERNFDLVNHSCRQSRGSTCIPSAEKLCELDCQIGTKHESWSSLAYGQNNIWNNQVLVQIAKNHDNFALEGSNLASLIRKLRNKIEPDQDNLQYILTVLGVGYIL